MAPGVIEGLKALFFHGAPHLDGIVIGLMDIAVYVFCVIYLSGFTPSTGVVTLQGNLFGLDLSSQRKMPITYIQLIRPTCLSCVSVQG